MKRSDRVGRNVIDNNLSTEGHFPTTAENKYCSWSRCRSRAVMDIIGWSDASTAKRFMHMPRELVTAIAAEVGALMWAKAAGSDCDENEDDVPTPLV